LWKSGRPRKFLPIPRKNRPRITLPAGLVDLPVQHDSLIILLPADIAGTAGRN
jgi:hypothetical protein